MREIQGDDKLDSFRIIVNGFHSLGRQTLLTFSSSFFRGEKLLLLISLLTDVAREIPLRAVFVQSFSYFI